MANIKDLIQSIESSDSSFDEKLAAINEMEETLVAMRSQEQEAIDDNVSLIVEAIKVMERKVEAQLEAAKAIVPEKGDKGEPGKEGRDGQPGRDGQDGRDGKDGQNGQDGVDGVSVTDAKIDFDGSLVITLSTGREINVGEVVAPDLAEKIKLVTSGGGTSQQVLDTLVDLQDQINVLTGIDGTLGTMAQQDDDTVAITGGSINGTTIGSTTPAAGTFTTLTATGQASIGTGSADFVGIVGFATRPLLFTTGTSTNISMLYRTKGTGAHSFNTADSGGNEQFRVSHTASAVNYVQVTGAATGSFPRISTQGSDSSASLALTAKSGTIWLETTSGFGMVGITHTAGANNYLALTGGVNAAPSISAASGINANIDLALTTKGIGAHLFHGGSGTYLTHEVYGQASSVNRFRTTSTATSVSPLFSAVGSDANISIRMRTQGTGSHQFETGSSGNEQLRVAHTASAVNYVQVTGAATGGSVVVSAQGSDANVPLNLQAKGSSYINAIGWMRVGTASANYIQLQAAGAGSAPVYTVQGSDTNIPLVLQPKGTGALQAQQTDSTATGGNARGANAVDWQTTRDIASRVASGAGSVVSGGYANTASIGYSVVSGGFNNTAGYLSSVVGGQSNSASGTGHSGIVGGFSNTASGYYNFIGGGANNSGTTNSVITTQSATMNGTTAVTLSGSNASIKVGQFIAGTSIADRTYVAAISGTSLTLSQAASGSSTSTLSFYTPHGVVVGGGNNQATGAYSFIGGGGDAGTAANRNVASGDWSVVVGGVKNVASGIGSAIAGGGINGAGGVSGNISSGVSSFVGAGQANVASAPNSSTLGGFNNQATGTGSVVIGGRNGTTRLINGFIALNASSEPLASATTQAGVLVLSRQTTDATATVLASDANAASTTNQVILPNNSAYFFRGEVVSGVTGGGNTKGWTIEGVIKRGANAASTTLVGTPTVTSSFADAGASAWTIAVTADTTNGGLAVTFTGQAATTIRTVAQIRTTEMTF
jgi:hypothetical protein